METAENSREKLLEISYKIISAAHAKILLSLRFLEIAMGNLEWAPVFGSARYACDGEKIYFDPEKLIKDFKRDQEFVVNLYLHEIFHLVFHHNFEYDKKNKEAWDLASDIAVWTVTMELDTYKDLSDADAERRLKLKTLRKRCPQLSAQKLYRLFLLEPPSFDEGAQLKRLFCTDVHELWIEPEKFEISLEQWKKITERIKADLKSFSKNKAGGESLDLELAEATRQKADYSKFLKQFMMQGEAMHINDDEFDYVYYTYGLENYGNMPLVEPLEYKDINRINEFVIAIDTSASCKGQVVKDFLQKTVNILKSEETFFKKMNVHIVQCDNQVQSDTKITCDEEFDDFLKNGKLTGFGSTDFRPVFDYVEKLKKDGELKKIKGLIYFTDGYGIYPANMPDFDVAFVFLSEDDKAPEVPAWAAKVVLDENL
ncbi:MAG: VWA-like domain-containing protein [Lachnospiraceae bacterium]|nr:VWA-like domain-containing protein [Lachnospiraceae bacterium]